VKSQHAIGLSIALIASPAFAANTDAESAVLAKEKSLWVAWQKKDGEAFRKAVTADSVQIITDTAPVVGRDAIVKAMTAPDCTLRSFTLKDETAHRLAPDVILLSYSATQDGACAGEPLKPKIQSTAIYVRQHGEWLERYYQETPAK
jgi:uncharacterized protein (TIGR02246 family)